MNSLRPALPVAQRRNPAKAKVLAPRSEQLVLSMFKSLQTYHFADPKNQPSLYDLYEFTNPAGPETWNYLYAATTRSHKISRISQKKKWKNGGFRAYMFVCCLL